MSEITLRRPAESIATLIVRLRYLVVAAWIALAVVAVVALPTIEEAQVGSLGDLVPRESEALKAELESRDIFGFPVLSRTAVVIRDASGLPDEVRRRALTSLWRLNAERRPPFENVIGALPLSNAQSSFGFGAATAIIGYLFIDPSIGQVGSTGIARLLADRLEEEAGAENALVTGPIPARAARAEIIREELPVVELATVILVILALGLFFRSVGVPLLNLAAVAISYLIAIRGAAWAEDLASISVPREVEPVIVVLLFGIVTDYAVFVVSRFRAKLAGGRDAHTAAREATSELLPVIATAGLIIAGATASLLVADLGFLKAFGPGLALAALVGAAVAITFLPAALAIAGEALLWPARPGGRKAGASSPRATRGPARSRAVSLAAAHPVLVALATSAVLLLAASGVLRLNVGNPVIKSLPESHEVREGFEEASAGFSPGITSPTLVVIDGAAVRERPASLARLQDLLEREPGVSDVVGASNRPVDLPTGALVASDAGAARYFVVLATDPLGSVAVNRVDQLARRMPVLLAKVGLTNTRALVGGDTALIAETIERTRDSLTAVAPVALAVVFVLLVLLLRAVIAPLYLIAASLLALTASLGLTTYVFQGLLNQEGLTFFVPFAAAVLLLALGSDYNVFLAGRIWAEARKRPLHEAVEVGGARAAAPITTAGLILALSFAALALIPIQSFRELAFAMSVGLLIDAFIVRTLLVPSLIVLVGRIGAWPGRGMSQEAGPTGTTE